MKTPRSFSLAAIETDYTTFAREMAFEVPVAYRINAEVEGYNGKTLLSGWHKSAFQKVTFFVHNPLNEEVARESVLQALREIAKTQALLIELGEKEDYLLPLITGIPVGCYWGQIKRVERKRDRKAAFLWDFIAEIQDSFRAKVREVKAQIEELNRKEAA